MLLLRIALLILAPNHVLCKILGHIRPIGTICGEPIQCDHVDEDEEATTNILSHQKPVTNENWCLMRCQTNAKCKWYSYFYESKFCFLYSSCPGAGDTDEDLGISSHQRRECEGCSTGQKECSADAGDSSMAMGYRKWKYGASQSAWINASIATAMLVIFIIVYTVVMRKQKKIDRKSS